VSSDQVFGLFIESILLILTIAALGLLIFDQYLFSGLSFRLARGRPA